MFSFFLLLKLSLVTAALTQTLFQSGQLVSAHPTDDPVAANLFDDRIMPIFRSEKPSSCIQCHLASVDLKNYILPSHEMTFVSLRDQGLIDLENPRESRILSLIDMGAKDADDLSRRIHEKMRRAEFEAFASWIEACVKDERIRTLPALDPANLARPAQPDAVIRHARKSRVVDSFARNIWSQRLRCFPCHTPHEIQPNQKKAQETFENWVDQYGDRMLIFKKSPEATIQSLIEKSAATSAGDLPLINLENPTQSLLLVKPISKIPPKVNGERIAPTYSAPVYHMGGLKIHVNDQSYKSFAHWLNDYANVVGGRYQSVADLPADNWYATKRIIRLKNVPEHWPVGTPVQMFVYSETDRAGRWSEKPLAFTQGTVTPRKIVNGALFLFAPEDESRFQQWMASQNKLPKGKYLVKVFVDAKKRIAKDPTRFLNEEDCVGKIEIANAQWKIGFPNAEMISVTDLTGK